MTYTIFFCYVVGTCVGLAIAFFTIDIYENNQFRKRQKRLLESMNNTDKLIYPYLPSKLPIDALLITHKPLHKQDEPVQ
jgi:hypothetical protein